MTHNNVLRCYRMSRKYLSCFRDKPKHVQEKVLAHHFKAWGGEKRAIALRFSRNYFNRMRASE